MFEKIISLEQLTKAYYKARRGKKTKAKVCQFDFNLENNLIKLKNLLKSGRYLPSAYTNFTIFDPKTRKVAAPTFCDRVVQHSLVISIEPLLEKTFILDSYACRKGKGACFAVKRVKNFLRAARCQVGKEQNIYVLAGDIQKYFQSINWDILFAIIKKTVDCPQTLDLIKKIIETHDCVRKQFKFEKTDFQPDLFSLPETIVPPVSVLERKGLPIGNLTSQLFANTYLNELDHYVKKTLREKWYARYMDDFLIISPDKNKLKEIREKIKIFLENELKLKLHPKKLIIKNVNQGIPFVGYRIFYDHILVRGDTLRHMQRKYRQRRSLLQTGQITEKDLLATKASVRGHLKHADAYNLSKFLD